MRPRYLKPFADLNYFSRREAPLLLIVGTHTQLPAGSGSGSSAKKGNDDAFDKKKKKGRHLATEQFNEEEEAREAAITANKVNGEILPHNFLARLRKGGYVDCVRFIVEFCSFVVLYTLSTVRNTFIHSNSRSYSTFSALSPITEEVAALRLWASTKEAWSGRDFQTISYSRTRALLISTLFLWFLSYNWDLRPRKAASNDFLSSSPAAAPHLEFLLLPSSSNERTHDCTFQ